MPRIVLDRIQVSHSAIPGELPPQNLLDGELWVNSADETIWVGVTGGPPVPVGDITASVVTATKDGLMSAADKLIFDQLIVDLATDVGDHADLRTKLAPILVNGWQATASVAGAGGVPTLDIQGRIDKTMIGGTDMAPAFAGEVPKFKANGLVDTSLIDYDFRSVTEPSVGNTPTAADSGKLVRLTHEGKISSNFLEIDPLDHQGVVDVGPAGTPLPAAVIDGGGQSGFIWMVRTDAVGLFDVNFTTGDVQAAAGGTAPAGYLRVKTGDLIVKDGALKSHLLNGELLNDGHLLPRDGVRAMTGTLRFDDLGTAIELGVSGADFVQAERVAAATVRSNDQPGTPGLPMGSIEHFIIDGAQNSILVRSGGDPTLGLVVGHPGEIYFERLANGVKVYIHDATSWQLVIDNPQVTIDALALLRQEFDALRADYDAYKAAHP